VKVAGIVTEEPQQEPRGHPYHLRKSYAAKLRRGWTDVSGEPFAAFARRKTSWAVGLSTKVIWEALLIVLTNQYLETASAVLFASAPAVMETLMTPARLVLEGLATQKKLGETLEVCYYGLRQACDCIWK
jgi:hypothetical protein